MQRLCDGSAAVTAATAAVEPSLECHAGNGSLMQCTSGGKPQEQEDTFLADVDWEIDNFDGEQARALEGEWLLDVDMPDDSLPDSQPSQEETSEMEEDTPVKPIDRLRARQSAQHAQVFRTLPSSSEMQASQSMHSAASSSVDFSIDASVHSLHSPVHSPGAEVTRGVEGHRSRSVQKGGSPVCAEENLHVLDSGGTGWQHGGELDAEEDLVESFNDWCAALQA